MRLNPETLAPAPAAESRWWRDPFYWAIALLLAAYAVVLAMNMEAYAAGPDPSGYLNSARLLAIGKVRAEQRTVPGVEVKGLPPMAFVPFAFRPVGEKQMIPTYPIGLPLAVMAAAHVTGWNLAPHATMLAMALLGILATAWLGCVLGLPRKWAWFGAILLGASPLYLTMSLVLMSDVPALVCMTCAIAAAWKSRECGLKWAFVAGVAVACGVFVRPTNALAIFPAAACLGVSGRRWGMFCLGGLPGAALWCLYNRAANGHFFETGYGQVAEPIAAQWIPGGWLFYIRWLPVLLTPLVLFAAGLPWLALRGGRGERLKAAVLTVWVFVFLAFYSADRVTQDQWGGLRYVLPVFPALIVGALMVIGAFGTKMEGWKNAPWLAVGMVAVYGAVCTLRLHAITVAKPARTAPVAAEWAVNHLPGNAVVAGGEMTGSLFCYTPFILVRSDWVRGDQWSELASGFEAAGRPVYAAVVYPYDLTLVGGGPTTGADWRANVRNFLDSDLPGEWEQRGDVDKVTFWEWRPVVKKEALPPM